LFTESQQTNSFEIGKKQELSIKHGKCRLLGFITRSVANWIEYVKLRLTEILVLRGQDTPVIRATRGAYQFVGNEAL